MRPDMVVLFEPHIDDDLGLVDACEPFGINLTPGFPPF